MKYHVFGHKQVEFRSDISKNNNMAALDERETQSEKNPWIHRIWRDFAAVRCGVTRCCRSATTWNRSKTCLVLFEERLNESGTESNC